MGDRKEGYGDVMEAVQEPSLSEAVVGLRRAILEQHRGMREVGLALSKVEVLGRLAEHWDQREVLDAELSRVLRQEEDDRRERAREQLVLDGDEPVGHSEPHPVEGAIRVLEDYVRRGDLRDVKATVCKRLDAAAG